jgi:membrane protease YdiL (CAAX protease family)
MHSWDFMDSTSTEPQSEAAVPFHYSHWKTRWLIIGLTPILLWRSSVYFDREWLSQIPWWIWMVVAGLIPQLFLLLFPIFTRTPRSGICIPTLRRCMIEFGIAIPVVVVSMAAWAALELLVSRLWSDASLLELEKRIAESPRPMLTYMFLIFSFTFAPVAEEVFFRGFLFNAFRVRMPWVLAIVTQSLLFGFSHVFGLVHSAGACVAGLILAIIYEWRKTLVTPILVHAGCNAVAAVGVVVMMAAYANSPILGVGGDPKDTACVIRQIVPDSAADKAGLQVGDVVIAFNGQAIHEFPQLANAVRLYQPGDTIPVSIKRDGTLIDVNVILQRRGDNDPPLANPEEGPD